MKTGPTRPSVVQVNFEFDNDLSDPDALLDRYTTLTGWAEAVRDAGAVRSIVVQQFRRRARVMRAGIEYQFVDGGVARAVAAHGPDVVHVNGLVFPLRTWRVRRALPAAAALVAQNHSDTGPLGRAPALRLAGRAARRAVDAFLFAAEEHADRWRRAGLIAMDQQTCTVMEASTRFEPLARARSRAATRVEGAPALLWVGRLNANKDPLTVLQAFEIAAASLPGATLTMIYSVDDQLDAVRAALDRSPALRDRVRLAGAVVHTEMPAWFSAADLFIVGSHHEGSGYGLIEALACGATPVVTDIPTFRLLDRRQCGRRVVAGRRCGGVRARDRRCRPPRVGRGTRACPPALHASFQLAGNRRPRDGNLCRRRAAAAPRATVTIRRARSRPTTSRRPR